MLMAPSAGRTGPVDQPTAEAEWDAALLGLYESQRTALVRLAVLLVDDRAAAEDVVQDAFLALQRRWHAVDPLAAAGYLRTSVVNGARSVLRRRGVARRHLRAAEPDEGPAADLALLLDEEHRQVVQALRTLPRRQREVLVLRYWSELSETEIATTLGIARGTVKSSASRGLSALEQRLGTRHDG
jgi:RNA polymerase sigma-70 factor (sigma-E family)